MSCVGREEVGSKSVGRGMCELFVGGGSTSATSVLLRRRYPLTVRGYLFALRIGGLAVAGPCPTSTLIRSYPEEPGRSLSATCDPFGSSLAEPRYLQYGKNIPAHFRLRVVFSL